MQFSIAPMERNVRMDVVESSLTAMCEARIACYDEFRESLKTKMISSCTAKEQIVAAVKERDQAVAEAGPARQLTAQLQSAQVEIKRLKHEMAALHHNVF